MSSAIWANVTVQGTLSASGTYGQTTYAPVDLGVNALSLATGNLTSLITTSSSAPTAFTANNAGEGSLYFPGTANAYISFGTTGQPFSNSNIYSFGDFVVEAWVNPTSVSNYPVLTGLGDPAGAGALYYYLQLNTSGSVIWWSNINSVASGLTTTATISTGAWTHLAVIHQSASKRVQVYINGQPQTFSAATGGWSSSGTVASYTTGIVPVTTWPLAVGQLSTSGNALNGYLTNLRVTTGSGAAQIYNNNAFTPSTSPLFPASNTVGGSLTTRLLLRVPLAQGKVQVQKAIGAPSTGYSGTQAFPPAPMSGYFTDLTGWAPYGQGKYVASASSEATAAWQAFDNNDSTGWSYNYTGLGNIYPAGGSQWGTYNGTTFTVDVSGNSYGGEWVQIQMPVAITLSSYTLYGTDTTYDPGSWYILGSRDGINWKLVHQVRMYVWASNGIRQTWTVSSTESFSYFRYVLYQSYLSGTANYNIPIRTLIFNGTPEGANFSSDGRVGIGVVNPTRNLEVAGDVVAGGTVSSGNPITFKNKIINGNFDVWQRGTSFASPAGGSYTADRWSLNYDGAGSTRTISQQTFTTGQTDVPGNPTYFYRFAQTVAGSGTYNNTCIQKIEGVRTFAGQAVVMSLWARGTVGTPYVNAALRQNFGTSGSTSVDIAASSTQTFTTTSN